MQGLAIGEVAARSGIAASAIRYYERRGLLAKPARRNGRRVYDASVVDQLELIALAKRAGFTVAEIERLQAGFARTTPPGARWRELARSKSAELDRRIDEARRMQEVLGVVVSCRCPTFRDCVRCMRARRRRRAAAAGRGTGDPSSSPP
jgi:MerR family redox-sensitive transcriptional activator SoxR